jgi:8-oxo-dGTP diphosphatase
MESSGLPDTFADRPSYANFLRMNDPCSIPTFGDKLIGQTYIERPGAYALVRDAHHLMAALRVGTAFFLPGGGSAPNETPQITLHREIMEECGRAIQIGPRLGKAIEYIYARDERVYYQLCSTFFVATFMDGRVKPLEDHHKLVWLSAWDAIQRLQRESQVWAVQQLVSSPGGLPGPSLES